jgi:hypothetical protein
VEREQPTPAERRSKNVAAGLLIWGAVLAFALTIASTRGGELGPPARRLARFAFHSPGRVTVELACIPALATPSGWTSVQPGDPVLSSWDRTFLGTVESVSEIRFQANQRGAASAETNQRAAASAETNQRAAASAETIATLTTPVVTAVLALDPEVDTRDLEGAPYMAETAAGDLAWVLATLLPESKRAEIKKELSDYAATHSEEIAQFVRPIGEDVLEHTMNVLDLHLAPALKAHEKEVQAVLDKHRDSLKEELIPVLKEQLGPSVKAKAQPILTRIGRELWNELPMWDLSLSWARNKLPWQSRDYVDEWWNRFLETKAIPIVKAHEDELVKAGEDLVQEGIRDPKVRAAFGEATRRLARDPDFKKVLRAIVEDALVRPFDAPALIEKLFANEGHRARIAALEESFAPTLRRIVRLVSMDGNGLSPDLARVLRRIVFQKDTRWVSVAARGPIRRISDESELVSQPAAIPSTAVVGSSARTF